MAVAEASFKIDIYSISLAFIDAKSVEDIGLSLSLSIGACFLGVVL